MTRAARAGSTAMNAIEKQAAFYRAYLIDDRGLIPLKRGLAAIVGLWLLVCLVAAVCPPRQPAMGERLGNTSFMLHPP
ncbi:MAG TPA: hypothetical protein VF886_06965 [Roseiarcus sp.]